MSVDFAIYCLVIAGIIFFGPRGERIALSILVTLFAIIWSLIP